MSLNQLTSDVYKPWLNMRVNNMRVDGTYVGPGGGGGSSAITVTAVKLANTPGDPFVISATITPDDAPIANSWYSAQFITFVTLSDNSAARKNIADILFFLNGAFEIVNATIKTSPYQIDYPLANTIEPTFVYSSPSLAEIRCTITGLQIVPAYRICMVISDIRRLC